MTVHLQQSKTSKTCGQHCLAMLAGVSLSEAIDAVGHRFGTSKFAILRAAGRLGLKAKTDLWRLPERSDDFDRLPDNCIARVRRKHRKVGHWICKVDGVIHDPGQAVAGELGSNKIIMSYMEFERHG